MPPARFRTALVLAVVAHVGLAMVVRSWRAPVRPAPADASTVEEIAVSEAPSEPPPPPQPALARVEPQPEASAALLRSSARAIAPSRAVPSVPDAPEVDSPPLAPVPSSSAAPRPVDLGIGDYWKTVARGGGGAHGEEPEGVRASEASAALNDGMRTELRARDRSLGLGPEGPVLSAAHDAASARIAPDIGTAVFDVECDSQGGNAVVRVLSAEGDRMQWNDVARELTRLLAAKRIHVPTGARGVRMRVQILAERTLPAGNGRQGPSPGAVNDDMPGSDPPCVGKGAERTCPSGMPVGATGVWGDLSNIGAPRSRIVRVRLVGETVL